MLVHLWFFSNITCLNKPKPSTIGFMTRYGYINVPIGFVGYIDGNPYIGLQTHGVIKDD